MSLSREPQAIAGVVSAGLLLFVAFGLDLDADAVDKIALAVSAVAALVGAFLVRQVTLALVTGAIKAAAPVIVVFGFDLAPEQTAAVLAFTETVWHFVARAQVSPKTPTPVSA